MATTIIAQMSRLIQDLKMSRSFALAEEEATLAICRTAEVLQLRTSELFKQFDVTSAQYNVLRILYGSPGGLPCRKISERMITHDPDVTRMLDRMELRQWIERKRDQDDRRVVLTCITQSGSKLVEELRPLIAAHHRRQYKGWEPRQLQQLLNLLDKVRGPESTSQKDNHAYLSD